MNTRRTLLLGAVSVPLVLSLGACTVGVSFQTVQTYVADADAVLDRLVPLVSVLDPGAAAELAKVQADADAAAKAFAALTGPTNGATTAQAVLTLISDGFTLIESVPGIPPDYVAAIAAAQLLLVTLGSFFSISPSVAETAIARAHPAEATGLWTAALAQYKSAPDKAKLADAADTQVRAWLAVH
jgi:hypothetical protein